MLVTKQAVLRRFWYAVMPLDVLAAKGGRSGRPFTLLGERLWLRVDAAGLPIARRAPDPDALVDTIDAAPLRCQARYGFVWVALDEPLQDIFDIPEDSDPGYRRIVQFDACWRTGALRLMENSFDAAHFAFVHKGTFGQFSQQKPEFFELRETEDGFEAETRLVINNPPASHRITGTTEPTTRRHFRNRWHLPFSRRLGMAYPNGLRHVIYTCATPIDDTHIQLLQWLYRNDTEADCPADELNAWDRRVIEEDKEILESVDANAPVDVSRRDEFSMPADQPGLIMRRRLLELLRANGEEEVYRETVAADPGATAPASAGG